MAKISNASVVKNTSTSREAGDPVPLKHQITFDFEGVEMDQALGYAVSHLVVKVQDQIRDPENYPAGKLTFKVADLGGRGTGGALVITPDVLKAQLKRMLESGEITQDEIAEL